MVSTGGFFSRGDIKELFIYSNTLYISNTTSSLNTSMKYIPSIISGLYCYVIHMSLINALSCICRSVRAHLNSDEVHPTPPPDNPRIAMLFRLKNTLLKGLPLTANIKATRSPYAFQNTPVLHSNKHTIASNTRSCGFETADTVCLAARTL